MAGKWSVIKLSPGGRKVCCPLGIVEMVERGVVHLKILVWHRDKNDSLQDSGLLLRNVDRASRLLLKGLMLHIVTKSLYDGYPSITKGSGAARVQNCTS